jgi:hypothetical protein
MRALVTHHINQCNRAITLEADDHYPVRRYVVSMPHREPVRLDFQTGPVADMGVNGLTNEVLLAVVADRLQFFQAGQHACSGNAQALDAVRTALDALAARSNHRVERGVEGTHEV